MGIMHAFVCGLEVQTDLELEVRHVGVQCDLLCPQMTSSITNPGPESPERNFGPVTSTPVKDSIPVVVSDTDISDINDLEDENTTVDATESTAYHESSISTIEPDDSFPVEKQSTYLVFESALLLLFSTCFFCRSSFCTIEKWTVGSLLRIKQICSQCNGDFTWDSQPYIGKVPAGNILISAAILYTGSIPAKALRIFKNLNCSAFTRKTFFRHQKNYLQPTINTVWERHQRKLISELMEEEKGLVLGGDGRADSPGHSAKYGSYSIIELNKNKVIDLKLVQVKELALAIASHMA